MLDSDALKWRFWLLWVLASAAGVAVFAMVARPVSMAVGGAAGQAAGGIVAEAVTGALALGGVMLGIALAQWLVVRRLVSWGGWSVLAMAVGGAVGGAGGLGTWAALGGVDGQTMSAVTGSVVSLTGFGMVQWLVLRGQVAWAGWWAVASILGLIAATFAAGVIGTLAGSEIALSAMYGAAYGAVTGAALMIFSSRAAPTTSVAHPSTT